MDDDHEERIKKLEALLTAFIGSSQFQFERDAKFYDGRNIQLGYQSGTKIGTDAKQKIGFFGKTPVVKNTTSLSTVADVIALLQGYGLN